VTPIGSSPAAARFEPVRLLDIELAKPLSDLSGHGDNGCRYRCARALVRLHGFPLGVVDLDLRASGGSAASVANRIWRELDRPIAAHLAADGLRAESAKVLPLLATATAACERERRAFHANAPSATVVIATRERPHSLAATLDSILALEYRRFQVVVVDSAPVTGATCDVVASRAGHPDLLYIREPLPGLAVAHNRGLHAAQGEIVAFVDDDVLVDQRWLLELARGFQVADGVACVTGLILPAELETPAQLWLEKYVRINKGYEPKLFDIHANRPGGKLFPYAAGAFGSGANMAFRTDVLRSAGGFDPATGAGTRARGGDDLAAFFGIIAGGYTLAYQPTALVRHRHRRELEALGRQMYDYGAGLSAYLTKLVVDRPGRLFDIARRAPRGAAHAFGARSGGRAWESGLSRDLARLERRGMLAGPAGYLIERSRRRSLYTSRSGLSRAAQA
jgi:O-antigen biosynthesis protein